MSSDVSYRDGDIVWVKLGPCWWPGEVVDKSKVPPDVTFKKDPLAIVKFFEEESFEYVKNANQINFYTCGKKKDYIKKGMDAYRAKHQHMENFPRHVCLAETKTQGNPDILSLPEFSPQKKKPNSYSELFGKPTPKKTTKAVGAAKTPRGRKSTGASTVKSGVTHRRFLGYDDHEVKILPQTKTSSDTDDDQQQYSCSSSCGFKTSRLEVIMLHNKSCTMQKTKKWVGRGGGRKGERGVRTKTTTFEEDLERIRKGLPLIEASEDVGIGSDGKSEEELEEAVGKKKGRRGRPKGGKNKKTTGTVEEAEKISEVKTKDESKKNETDVKKIDIVQLVLSSWSDDEEEEATTTATPVTTNKPEETINEENDAKKIESCFDFSEEEEEKAPSAVTSVGGGRKIPRVIPEMTKSENVSEEENPETNNSEDKSAKTVPEENLDEFMDILEQTKLPELPDVPEQSKKRPAEKEEESPKLINPKKRFVKSFEDFEIEQKKLKDEAEAVEETETITSDAKEEEQNSTDCAIDEIKSTSDTNSSTSSRPRRSSRRSSSKYQDYIVFPDSPKANNKEQQPSTPTLDENTSSSTTTTTTEKPTEMLSCPLDIFETPKPIEAPTQPNKSLEVEKLKSQLMSKLTSNRQSETCKLIMNDWSEEEEMKTDEKSDFDLKASKKDLSSILHDTSAIEKNTVLPTVIFEDSESNSIAEKIEETVENGKTGNLLADMSALTTLAEVSELSTAIGNRKETSDKNITFLSEEELTEGQIEIASEPKVEITKPTMSLSSFSMDYSETTGEVVAAEAAPEASDKPEEPATTETVAKNGENRQTDVPMDIEEQIPPSIVRTSKPTVEAQTAKVTESNTDSEAAGSKKLLEVLTTESKKVLPQNLQVRKATPKRKLTLIKPPVVHQQVNTFTVMQNPPPRVLNRSLTPKVRSKPIILSEKVIRPSVSEISVQKVTSKRSFQDVEDIDTFIIKKPVKRVAVSEELIDRTPEIKQPNFQAPESRQPIVQGKTNKPKAKILQQTIITPSGDVIHPSNFNPEEFDINSMPIVLSDQILTPENIDNVPIVFSSETGQQIQLKVADKPVITGVKKQRPQQVKLLAKVGGAKTVTKPTAEKLVQKVYQMNPKLQQQAIVATSVGQKPGKYLIIPQSTEDARKINVQQQQLKKIATNINEPSGNKIMIVTNQQGQQSRVLLTPAQQKILGYQGRVGKGGKVLQDQPQQILVAKKKIQPNQQVSQPKVVLQKSKSVVSKPVIKGQLSRKLQQINDEALLDQQVREQIQAIKASGAKAQSTAAAATNQPAPVVKAAPRRSYAKKPQQQVVVQPKQKVLKTVESGSVPPLAPISPSKVDDKATKERPLSQLVIQDSMGNQTTITEGQILAFPSETVDGQPQSYMLVTVDESGNLTPLNNEALMSLDPNLTVGSDLSNVVLQVNQDQPTTVATTTTATKTPIITEAPLAEPQAENKKESTVESNQQLIVTGDPVAAQKFLESLTEGNADLANLLANAEGGILIQADGQQILINPEDTGKFEPQVNKGQDILAAALADTDVFQPEAKQLSPNMLNSTLETSLTLSSPIMTPLEVPTSTKKLSETEAGILQVPKNVDLPITITDPNISQTVNQQQQQMLQNEFTCLNQPNFTADQQPISMPSLTDDDQEQQAKAVGVSVEEEGLCALGQSMCSSLSEPPPDDSDMFDMFAGGRGDTGILSKALIEAGGLIGEEEKGEERVAEGGEGGEGGGGGGGSFGLD